MATVLFTDIVGSTERASELGDRRWHELLGAHHAVVREELQRHGGQEIATAGDGFLAVFDGPTQALLCAAAIRDAVGELALSVRCGLHMGEIRREPGDVGGIAIHIGARVAALAGPDEILVSGTIRDTAVGSDFGFADRGRHALRGVDGKWRVYALTDVPEEEVAALAAPEPIGFLHRCQVGVFGALRRGQQPRMTRGRAIAGGLLAFALLFVAAGVYVLVQDRGRSLAPGDALADAAPGIAVLPFQVGEGLEDWREGAVDLIGANLDGAAGLRAIDSRTLLARWRETVQDGEEPDLATSLNVARRTGALYALVGSASSLGHDLRLTANVYELSGDKNLGQAQVQGSRDSVYVLVDQLSIRSLQVILQGDSEDLPRIQLARATTASLPALKSYLEGEVLFRKADWRGALAAYRDAVQVDSTFSLAWLRVSQSIGWMRQDERPEGGLRAAVQNAARHSDRLSERESVLILAHRAYVRGSMTMIESLEAATRRYPDDPELVYLLGEHYVHFGEVLMVEPAVTERVLDHAIELDPWFAPHYQHAIEYALYRADSARALELLGTFERLAGDTREARLFRLAATLAWGSEPDLSAALVALDTLPRGEIPICVWFSAPRFLALGQACSRAIFANDGNAGPLVDHSLRAGQVSAIEDVLREGELSPGLEAATRYQMRQRGLPVDAERLRAVAQANDQFPVRFFGAILGAEVGQSDKVEAARAMARAYRDARLMEGDTLGGKKADAEMQILDGYEALHGGERERGLDLLIAGQMGGTGGGGWIQVNAVVRWTIADLLVELGRPEEAIPYYRSFRFDPFAIVELGRIYEGLGRVEDAKAQYETALAYWRVADPTLAPRIADVRRRLAGLGFSPRS